MPVRFRTGIPVSKQRSEISHNFDAGLRWTNKWFDTEFTVFRLDLNDTIVKQALILPNGAVGQFLGDQPIVSQLANGVVFVPLSTAPVLIRANYTDAKLVGIEYEFETNITRDFKFQGNFTYIRAEDKATGLPPNIEGGTPPPTGFLSLEIRARRKAFLDRSLYDAGGKTRPAFDARFKRPTNRRTAFAFADRQLFPARRVRSRSHGQHERNRLRRKFRDIHFICDRRNSRSSAKSSAASKCDNKRSIYRQ